MFLTAAVAMADRIASERGEKVGQTVGYQIRLESRVSPRTLLTFCTNGVLLRTLMGSGPYKSDLDEDSSSTLSKLHWAPNSLASVTHIIIDEVHERDRFSDFLLTVLRDALVSFPSLKLILMSATIDVRKFSNYFVNAHHMHVPGKIYPVKQIFLEDVLLLTNYNNSKMDRKRNDQYLSTNIDQGSNFQMQSTINALDMPMKMCQDVLSENSMENFAMEQDISFDSLTQNGEFVRFAMEDDIIIEPDDDTKCKADNLLFNMFRNNCDKSFNEFIDLITSDESHLSVDYLHSETGATILMCAAIHNRIEIIENLLVFGADPSLKAKNGWTAHDFAICNENEIAADIIVSYKNSLASIVVDEQTDEIRTSNSDMDSIARSYDDLNIDIKRPRRNIASVVLDSKVDRGLTEEQIQALKTYQKMFNDDSEKGVDKSLIAAVVKFIIAQEKNMEQNESLGSILVFLPGYEDIIGVSNLLKEDSSILVLMLHSQMVSLDQKKVFHPPPKGLTKVILATNIAETSITINDVRYVIDTGKVKEKSYDSLSGATMLKVAWISQDSAIQRMGRAGRTQSGICFRLFSCARYDNMLKNSVPEILRTPLTELCLATKLLAPIDTPIADFLSKAPDPPSFTATRAAVEELKQMEAIDSWEGVTELGSHLLDLPIEPRLGKMVLYAVVLKCLDPILTIVCCVSYKDPFILSPNPALKAAAKAARHGFSGGSISDHMALLRVFQGWQKARVEGNEKQFCYNYQISTSTMEMITGMRTQLLGQLRASGFVRAKGFGDIRDLNKYSENWAVVKAALVGGAYPNLARYDRDSKLLRTSKESKVRLHPNSVILNPSLKDKSSATSSGNNQKSLGAIATDWFLFDEMSRAGRLALIRGVTAISPVTVAIFAGPIRVASDENTTKSTLGKQENEDSGSEDDPDNSESNCHFLKIDEMIVFRTENDIVSLLSQLRQKWGAMFLRRLQCAGKPMTQVDDCVVNTLVTILNSEEIVLKLNQPVGIGQRPKAIPPPDSCNSNFKSFSPRKGNRSKTPYEGNRYTAYKEKSSIPQSLIQPQQSVIKEIDNPYELKSGSLNVGNGEMVEQIDSSTKYFVIKATNSLALEFSIGRGRWQFGNQTEHRLTKAIKSGYSVILIFSVQGSSHFQGFASFSGRVSPERFSELKSQGQGSGSGTQYFIDWIKKGNVPFQATKHLLNLYNDKRKVQTSRDGQELDPILGSTLCKMWNRPSKFPENERCGLMNSNMIKSEGNQDGYPKSSRRIVGRYQSS